MASLTAKEIEELKRIAALDEPSLMDLAEVCGQLPRLLAMLQPPVAADVAAAREYLKGELKDAEIADMEGYCVSVLRRKIRLLLSDHARLAAENERLRAIHEAELGVCEKHCTVVAAQAERIKRLEEKLEFEKASYRSLAAHHNEHCVCMDIY